MLHIKQDDQKIINNAYNNLLLKIKEYLQQYNLQNELEYSNKIISLLNQGIFSINHTLIFDNLYDYLDLPSQISNGVQVTYGICCCRHATEFLSDILHILNFNPEIIYFWLEKNSNTWHKVTPASQKANHEALIINHKNRYLINPANNFILKIAEDGSLKSLNFSNPPNSIPFTSDYIPTIAKTLKKYYTYKELGIRTFY